MFLQSRRTTLPSTWRSSLHLRLMALGLTPLLVAFPLIMGILVFIGGEFQGLGWFDQHRDHALVAGGAAHHTALAINDEVIHALNSARQH